MHKAIVIVLLMLFLTVTLATITAATTYTNASTFENNRARVYLTRIDPNPVAPGEYFDLYAKIEVVSKKPYSEDLSDIKIVLIQDYPFSLDSQESPVRYIGPLKQGQSADMKFRVKVDENAVSGQNSLRFEYSSDKDTMPLLSTPLFINVRSRDTIVSIDRIEITPEQVAPGSVTSISISIMNNADNSIRDVKIAMPLEGLPFATVNSLSEKRIKRINTGKGYEFKFDVIVDPNAASAVYKIPLGLSYYDDANNFFTKNSTFGMLVGAKPLYQMDIENIDSHQTNKAANVVVSLSNIGPSDIKYATIKVLPSENYEIISQDRRYIGNLEPDDFETAEFQLYVKKKGNLKLELNYKDSYLHEYNAMEELELPIFSKGTAVKYGIAKQNGAFGQIVQLAVILILIAVIYVWVKTRNLPGSIKHVFKKIVVGAVRVLKFLKPENLGRKFRELRRFIKSQ